MNDIVVGIQSASPLNLKKCLGGYVRLTSVKGVTGYQPLPYRLDVFTSLHDLACEEDLHRVNKVRN